MDLRQLRYFVAAVEAGSITQAAAALRVAQPAVSARLRDLEDSLGVPLLQRSRGGVVLTRHGHVLLDHARAILRQVGVAAEEVRAAGAVSGQVVLGMPGAVTSSLVGPLLARLSAEHPALQLRIVEAMTATLLEWLHAGRLDVAVLFSSQNLVGLNATEVDEDELWLVGPPGRFDPARPMPLTELPGIGLITAGSGSTLRGILLAAARSAGVELDIICELDAISEMLNLARQGLGCTVLAPVAFAEALARGEVSATPLVPAIRRKLVAAIPAYRTPSRAADLVVNLIGDTLGRARCKGALPPSDPPPKAERPLESKTLGQ